MAIVLAEGLSFHFSIFLGQTSLVMMKYVPLYTLFYFLFPPFCRSLPWASNEKHETQIMRSEWL